MGFRTSFAVDAESGHPFTLDETDELLAEWAFEDQPADQERLVRIAKQSVEKVRGLPYGVDERTHTDAGWGMIFAENENPLARGAGLKLIEHRRAQFTDAKKRDRRCKELTYRGERTAQEWVVNQGGDAGSVDPRKIPYYLLVVGGPERIPFHFTQDLAVEYRVGRLAFDEPENYPRYVDNLIAWEKETTPLDRRVAFFGPRYDRATELSSDRLLRPLLDGSDEDTQTFQDAGFIPLELLEDEATSEALARLLGDPARRPSFLFTASHGADLTCGHADQRRKQGNLVCQSLRGEGNSAMPQLFGPKEIPAGGLTGMVTFAFACHSAGTPRFDSIFRDKKTRALTELASEPFVSALGQAMLANGAVGFIGHIDLALGKSLLNPRGQEQLLPYRNLVSKILNGLPLGMALQDIHERYASLSAKLGTLQMSRRDSVVPDEEIVNTWLGRNDAGGYVLLGDPAARLRLGLLAT